METEVTRWIWSAIVCGGFGMLFGYYIRGIVEEDKKQ